MGGKPNTGERDDAAGFRDRPSHRYEIRDATGRLIAVHRREDGPDGKRMWWELPDGTRGLGGEPVTALPLYGIERLTAMTDVVLVEGERAADALRSIGVSAVGTVTGAHGTPSREVLGELAGRRVRLWPDNDAVGREHMDRIARELAGIASAVEDLVWADAPDGGDAADFVGLGRMAADVGALPIHAAHQGEEERAESQRFGRGGRPIHSAQTPTPGTGRAFPFRTAREFASEVPEAPEWIAGGYVAVGALTAVEGKIKAAGKTTFVTHLCRAVLDGRPFLGEPTTATPIIYLTEQPFSSFREALRRADLLDRSDFVLLPWAEAAAAPWPDVVAAATAECHRRGALLLVVDTLGRFAGIRGDGENSAGEAQAAMAPLQVAAADGLAVLLVLHERKAGGPIEDAGRGSSAFGGAVDIVLALRRLEGNGPANRRVIYALSRFDETPDVLVVELTASGYVALGNDIAVTHAEARVAVLELLTVAGVAGGTIDGLVAGARPRTTVQRALDELLDAGTVVRTGRGVKGDPYRFALAAAPAREEPPPETPVRPARTPSGIDAMAELLRNLGSDIATLGEYP